MDSTLRALLIDASSGFYRMERYPLGQFFGPVDLGLHLAGQHDALSFGGGLLAGSILPGSNRLIVTGFSPCWGGFYISSMGGAALVFDNLGLNLASILGRAARPSVLYLNRSHGEEIRVELAPVDLKAVWGAGRGGIYGLLQYCLDRYADRYPTDPRVLAVGPAAAATDMGAIGSAPVRNGRLTFVDTWAGRGGLGSRLLQRHNIAAVIYGGSYVDEDFRDRKVADGWFQERYAKRLSAKDFDATIKYRFDPVAGTGGTLGVNYAKMGGRIIAFNYRSMGWAEEERVALHKDLVLDHYLKQFNEETIETKSQSNCGEPCAAVCKKMRGEFKKDYEPYQTMGPLCGIFDQRAAESVNHAADSNGFDAISVGGVLAWLMECVAEGDLSPAELGLSERPQFSPEGFAVEADSEHNAAIARRLIEGMVQGRGLLDLSEGARALAGRLSAERGPGPRDRFLYTAFARRGWMVPNQYWSPGVLAPMPIMGKYYNDYGADFLPPRELGRRSAGRFVKELVLDQLGTCRFHRQWAEDMLPDIVEELWGAKQALLRGVAETAARIESRNAAVPWESARNRELVHSFLRRRSEVDGDRDPALVAWLDRFEKDGQDAAEGWWYEVLKGLRQGLREQLAAEPGASLRSAGAATPPPEHPLVGG